MVAPAAFHHDQPALRTVLTEDAARCLADFMTREGLGRALIVTSERESRSALATRVLATLGPERALLFARSEAHPTLATAETGAALARKKGVDCLIALGGGGASDQAKGIALWLAEGRRPEPIAFGDAGRARHGTTGKAHALPILAVPTTASGAELTPGFGQLDEEGRKRLFRDYRVFCRLVVLDPAGIAATPQHVLLPTVMNALAHGIEALYSKTRDPISDSFATAGLARLHRGLADLTATGGSSGAYEAILVGSHLLGRSIINARTGLHHAICHVLGAAGLAHGHANSIMLPHVIRFNGRAAGSLLAPACRRMGLPDCEPAALADHVDAIARRFGLPRRLSQVATGPLDLDRIAAQVMQEPGRHFNPRPIEQAREVRELVARAL